MTVLLVDDQRSIIEGLLSGVPFDEIGFDTVLTANDAGEAWAQLAEQPVDVLLTDIEMPGESGMELVKKARDRFPDLLCILLTSHADFAFAKESVRLGCFDYLVQPAPYQDIAACLRRAFDQQVRSAQQKYMQSLGRIVQTSEPGMTSHMVMKLYSADPRDVAEGMQYLIACGYVVERDTPVRLCVAVDYAYLKRLPERLSEDAVIKIIRESFALAPGHPVPLITRNPYRQFVVMLCHADGAQPPACTAETFASALEEMTRRLGREPTLYVGPDTTLLGARGVLPALHRHIDNNVLEKTGVIMADERAVASDASAGGADMFLRWQSLLENEKYEILGREVQAYLDRSQRDKLGLHSLSDLHQRLTQLIFEHLHSRQIDIMRLFTQDYTYAMYMDSFKTVHALREGVNFLLEAAAGQRHVSLEQSDVDRAKAYIYAHLNQPMYVTDVAAHVNLSSEYFTKLFKKETGQNIKDFITQAKINAARDLLEHSDIPVSLVALEMGYDNFSHFTQIFKKACGLTPSEYRKEWKERKL
ncbi:MAG: helix-turn-helix domain-containing protein [Clostridia bacterium]|nr:helix-turn-helix domain-containing protein [Clostridia bacterium]